MTIRFAIFVLLMSICVVAFAACGGGSEEDAGGHGGSSSEAAHGEASSDGGHGEETSDEGHGGGHGEETAKATPRPTPTPVMRNERGEELVTFDPELLLTRERTMEHLVTLPLARGELNEPCRFILSIRLAVECGDAATAEAIEANKEAIESVILEAITTKKLAFARSTVGRMQLKEEIIFRLRNQEFLQGVNLIKELYYQAYLIERP